MTALAANRPTEFLEIGCRRWRTFPVAADVIIWAGGLVAINASGNLVPVTAASQKVVGIACTEINTTGLAAAAKELEVDHGIVLLGNSAADEALSKIHVEDICYAADDQTVSKTDGGVAQVTTGTVVYDNGSATGFTITGVVPTITVNAATSAAATATALANVANARGDFSALYIATTNGANIIVSKRTSGTFTMTKVISGAADITGLATPTTTGSAATRPVAGKVHIVSSRGVYVRVCMGS